ncbi:hypothetical protein [Serratia ureilytica]|uniref:hypothetical protein n=1 Tax=Serratia ureilytica TaxID=300181 RepID=UPI0018D6A8E6|nr:hypothetical protein [Serratia ureilytica]MBH3122428.1 hypothetical protein [Serratia ureilytica]
MKDLEELNNISILKDLSVLRQRIFTFRAVLRKNNDANNIKFEKDIVRLLDDVIDIVRGAIASIDIVNKPLLKNVEVDEVNSVLLFVENKTSDMLNLSRKSSFYEDSLYDGLISLNNTLDGIKPIIRAFVVKESRYNNMNELISRSKDILEKTSGLHEDLTIRFTLLDEKTNLINKIISTSTAKLDEITKGLSFLEDSNGKYQKTLSLLDIEVESLAKKKSDLDAAHELLGKVKRTYETNDKSLKEFNEELSKLQTSVSTMENRATTIEDELNQKTAGIDLIMNQANAALETTTTVSVGTFFKEQYDISKNRMFIWPSFALAFLIGAIWICYDTLSDIRHGVVGDGAELSYIIARFCIAPLFLLGVWFCTNQYIKQKNITEDYAYKKVLSLSLIGFKSEIQKTGEANTTGFIKSLLKEILRSPLETLDKKHYKRETKLLKLAHDEMISNMFKKASPQKTEVEEEKK